jgi:hypothetical protein
MKEVIIKALTGLGVLALVAVLFALPVLLLWNWVMPDVFGVETINFWQALGMNLLAGILFRGYTGK